MRNKCNNAFRLILAIWVLVGIAAIACSGGPVDVTMAAAAADALIAPGTPNAPKTISIDRGGLAPGTITDPESGDVLAYVFELDPKGYIVVCGETRLTPILAYSFEGEFEWNEADANVLLHLLRADLGSRFAALRSGDLSSASTQAAEQEWETFDFAAPKGASEVIGPLIESTTWAQDVPWNSLTPIDPQSGRRSLVGCVATSLAQIIAYWQYPSRVVFTSDSDYVTSRRQISISAASASIPMIEYASRDFYNPSDEVMAELSYAAGVSINMDYASNGSGAYVSDLAHALAGSPTPYMTQVEPGVWGFESADLRTYVRFEWGGAFTQSREEFYASLQQDLSEGEPVVLNLLTSSTSIGHAIICDGYDAATGRYHLNMGWGGQSDGWYSLPEDVPAGYNVVECGVFNIRPAEAEQALPSTGQAVDTSSDSSSVLVSIAPIPLETETVFSVHGQSVHSFSVRIFLLNGSMVWSETVSEASEIAWDGRDAEGNRVANGPYIYVASGLMGSNPFTQRGTLFVQR